MNHYTPPGSLPGKFGLIHGGGQHRPGRGWSAAPLRLVARPDARTAQVIDYALRLYHARGHLEAIDYLVEAQVPLRIISRVLWQPRLRRVTN
ncbi:hypothetical protein GJ699_07650 [Duganella sp. FT80W]|uniref:Uncharacterized protein n=1 Tax=Duganella guangzhouensis TaxID=2666084 RepID=A0A6I2KZF3_9BURK|nr:hypothetical protein [Duganella guangzhouensis]MRW89854.1 hypothetical protein [Duganella guangzhouensis]